MGIPLAFEPAGKLTGRTAVVRTAAPARRRASPPLQAFPERGEDVGLEALGQILAEPRGFPARMEASTVSDVPMDANAGDGRPATRIGSARFFAANRIQRAVLGGLDAAIVIVLLLGSMAVTGYHVVGAFDGLAAAHDAVAHATAASGTMTPSVAERVPDQVTSSVRVHGQGI